MAQLEAAVGLRLVEIATSAFGDWVESTDTDPSVRYQMPSVARSRTKRIDDPPT